MGVAVRDRRFSIGAKPQKGEFIMKLFNAFSIQMVAFLDEASVSFKKINIKQAKSLLAGEVESYIGHADTAVVVSGLLDMNVPAQRRFGSLVPGETAIVAQVLGGRLPEGCTTLPDGFSIQFFQVTVQ